MAERTIDEPFPLDDYDMILCPECHNVTPYEHITPAVTVGEPRPAEAEPCRICGGEGWVTVAEANSYWERKARQAARDNAPPADVIRRARTLFK